MKEKIILRLSQAEFSFILLAVRYMSSYASSIGGNPEQWNKLSEKIAMQGGIKQEKQDK